MTEEWEVVAARLRQWKTFPLARKCAVKKCRARNKHHDLDLPEIRRTSEGNCCIMCWLDWEPCEVCGTGPAIPRVRFRGQRICRSCLVPDIEANAWRDWLLYFVYVPRSAFVQVLEDAFAEDARRATTPSRRLREWSLTAVRV